MTKIRRLFGYAVLGSAVLGGAVLALSIAVATDVQAQSVGFGGSPGSFTTFNFPIISPQFSRHVLQMSPDRNKPANRNNGAQPARGSQSDLVVGHDATVSARARQAFLDDIRRGESNGLTRQIELSMQQRDVRSQFGEAISPYGLRPDNLADVCAAYYAAMWMTANRAPLPTRSQVQALSRQIDGAFLAGATQLDAAQRQQGAEEIMYKTVWLIHLRQEAQRLADQQAQQQLADVTWQAFKRDQALDLRATRLTDAGLVANQ